MVKKYVIIVGAILASVMVVGFMFGAFIEFSKDSDYTVYNISFKTRTAKEIKDILYYHNSRMDKYGLKRTVEFAVVGDEYAAVVMTYPYETISKTYDENEYSYDSDFLRNKIIEGSQSRPIDYNDLSTYQKIEMSTWDIDCEYFEPYTCECGVDFTQMVAVNPGYEGVVNEKIQNDNTIKVNHNRTSEYIFEDANSKLLYVFVLKQW